jgi:predicted NodU family carbamoyl transferase
VRDGQIIAAAQEERFTRKKHDAAFPKNAVAYCLREGGIQSEDLDYVAFMKSPSSNSTAFCTATWHMRRRDCAPFSWPSPSGSGNASG